MSELTSEHNESRDHWAENTVFLRAGVTERGRRGNCRDEVRETIPPREPPEMVDGDDNSIDGIVVPRVGGTYGGTAWTGGSNIATRKATRPKTIFARRPTDFRGAEKIEETMTCGLIEAKRLGIEASRLCNQLDLSNESAGRGHGDGYGVPCPQ